MQIIVAVSGIKNSGKTTLIERLVSELTARGRKVAVIKHDGHEFECDIPGTDTHRFAEHGAYGTACFSENRMFVQRTGTGESYEQLTGLFPEADVIFIEGAKNSGFNKMEVVRSAVSKEPVSNPEGRFLIVTDMPAGTFNEKTANIDDISAIADMIDKMIRRDGNEIG